MYVWFTPDVKLAMPTPFSITSILDTQSEANTNILEYHNLDLTIVLTEVLLI